jgi:hypothetical protein
MKVKTLSRNIIALPPQEGTQKVTMTVNLDANSGAFSLNAPKAIVDLMGIHPGLQAQTLGHLEDQIDRLIEKYEIAARLRIAEQVIVVNYRSKRDADVPIGYTSNFTEFSHDAFPSLVMSFDYEILLRVGDKLYSQEFEGAPLNHEGSANSTSKRIIIDWSLEAENMFEEATRKLQAMIEHMDAFLEPRKLAENIQQAISTKNTPMLQDLRPESQDA